MKVKGISFWEQNVEKIFLGVVGVLVLGALGYQYVLQNSTVTVGKTTTAPDKSMEPVAKAARELKGKLEATDPKLPEVPNVDLAQHFDEMMTGRVVEIATLYPVGKGLGLSTGSVTENKGDRVFAEVTVPGPTGTQGHAFRSTVSPYEALRSPDVKAVLPAEQPFDKAAASIEASFDGTALKAAFQNDPDGAGPVEALLSSWWRDTEIIGVELERQTQNSDGSWTEAAIVPAMPGRANLLNEVKKVKSMGDLPLILGVARSQPDAVQRVPYYSTISGVEWKPPAELAEAGNAAVAPPKNEHERLQQRIDELTIRWQKVEQQLVNEQKVAANKPKAPAQQPAGGGGKQRQEAPQATSSSGPTKSATERSRDSLLVAIDKAKKDLADYDAKQNPGATPGTTTPQPALIDGKAAPLALFDNPKVRVWSHDVTVEQGKTYRYRLRIAVNNPLFGHVASLKPEQAALAKDAVSRSEWSEWSDSVTVDPTEFYFVTSASERDVTGPTRASAELYKFYYGYYRCGTVTVEPGDALSAEMKIPDGLRLWDMAKLAALNPNLAPVAEAAAPAPGEGGGSGGRGRMTRVSQPDRGTIEAGGAPPPAAVPNAPPADGSWKPAPKSMRMAVDAMLLDVGPVALTPQNALGGTRNEQITQAFLRVADGAIQVRVPRVDQADPAYQRLKKNSEAGLEAGKVQNVVPANGAVPPPPPPPVDQKPRPPQPGPGGGAGGG